MLVPLIIKTDYSLLKSLVTVKELIPFLLEKKIDTAAIVDNNLYGCMEFYNSCLENNIKPIIGLEIIIAEKKIYLYAEDFFGFQNMLKLHSILNERDLTIADLSVYKAKITCGLRYESYDLYEELNKIFKNTYLFYHSDFEKNNALIYTKNIVYGNEIKTFKEEDTNYLKYLEMMDEGSTKSTYKEIDIPKKAHFSLEAGEEDIKSTKDFANLFNLTIPKDNKFIPKFDCPSGDSYKYLVALAKKGLEKRCNGNVPNHYKERLKSEIDIIERTGYIDYFLIVYDYIKYAKTSGILVGPGRGSAAGSLVSYCLGITDVDPIEYNLLFERFLNPERITMPDIDIDFEDTRRGEVIDYVKDKYGEDKVAGVMTFGTLKSKQALRDVARIMEVEGEKLEKLMKMIDAFSSLDKNLKTKKILLEYLKANPEIKEIYRVALKLENLKRHISTHAAGIVICSTSLDTIIPMCKSGDEILTGVTMEYLEDLGLLKMDFLALRNLTVIANVIKLIESSLNEKIDLHNIPLDDKDTLKMFENADTTGIFQYESGGMTNFLAKLKPKSFSDLVAAVALFRPGPMDNIDEFIKRKEGKIAVTYLHDSLKDILSETYGIIVYQEQIMLILRNLAGFSFAEADNIRRAMSKKKKNIIEEMHDRFIKGCQNNNINKELAEKIYELILKFAGYGFPKAHSVAYALIGYQMAYLKTKYPLYFMANLISMVIGSEIKTKEYIDVAKKLNIPILKPNINSSEENVKIENNALLLPLTVIKNMGDGGAKTIINERKNGEFKDFFDFISRTYGKSVTRKTIEALIDANAFRDFKVNHATLYKNIDSAINYGELTKDLDESLVMKPALEEIKEYSESELMQKEVNIFGFYVTNHPAGKYTNPDIIKLNNLKPYFDKRVKCVVLIEDIKKIKTKTNEEMAFINASDETAKGDFVIFPKKFHLLEKAENGELMTIYGTVSKRRDKYQVVISNIEKIRYNTTK